MARNQGNVDPNRGGNHIVESGDKLSDIAKVYYGGDVQYIYKLGNRNGIMWVGFNGEPNLETGKSLVIPCKKTLDEGY